jgi:hypothetical protein
MLKLARGGYPCPQLKPADVHDALAYAYDHIAEIEAGLAADDEALVKKAFPKGPPAS